MNVQRYKVGYYSDGWGVISNTPCLLKDDNGYAVKFEDYEQLRQRVQELEKDCDEYHQVAMNHIHANEKLTAERDSAYKIADHYRAERDALKQELEDFESDIDTCTQHNVELQLEVIQLNAERDAMKKLYESSEESVLSLKETRNRLAEERDAAIKLQDEANALLIEQARANESLKLERDELLDFMHEIKTVEPATKDLWIHTVKVKASALLASVKEKA